MNNPGTSGEMKFKASMKILKKDDGAPVYYKIDGGRFQYEETIKILTASQYKVVVEFKPTMELSSLKIADIDLNFKLVNDPEIDGKSIYELTWSTYGIDPTLSRHRAVVPVSLKFKNYKALSFSLQCKFYPEEDTKHITWGKVLNSIGVQCVIRRGSNFSSADNVVLS